MGLRDHIPKPNRKRGRIGDAGRASEAKVGKSLGAKMRPASGAMEGLKGDMTLGDFLIESKSTVGASMSIKHAWLGKISSEAMFSGKQPALTVTFTWPDGSPVNYGEWVMVPLHVWKGLIDG